MHVFQNQFRVKYSAFEPHIIGEKQERSSGLPSLRYKIVFRKKKKAAEPAAKDNVVEIPPENAPIWKKLSNTGYILLHPDLKMWAFAFAFFRSMIEVAVILLVGGFLFSEVQSFIYLGSHYGFIR